MTLSREEVERALIPAVKRGGMVSLTAGTVTGPRHVDGQIVDGPTGPVGQEGYVLNVDGHRMWLPFDAAVPKARHLVLTTAATVPNGTDTTITTGWTSGAKDDASGIPFTGGMFIAPSAGVYLLNVGAMWAANATGFRWIQFRHNGALGPTMRTNPAPSGITTHAHSQIVNATAGDALGFTYHQTSGGGLACGGHAAQTWLQCARIS